MSKNEAGNNAENVVHPLNKVRIPLFQTAQAITALRASGHTFDSACGEILDNSQESGAKNIHVMLESKGKGLFRVVFIDDGKGMGPDVLPMAIGLGSTTRPDGRKGIGRFGVGATLGGISQGRKIEYYSKVSGGKSYYTYLNIDELSADARDVNTAVVKPAPSEYAKHVETSGTIVIWENLDLFNHDGKAANKIDIAHLKGQLMFYIARTYRKFINSGLKIYVNGTEVEAWDPLFLMETPRFPHFKKSELIFEDTIEHESSNGQIGLVEIKVTLLHEMFRQKRHMGSKDKNELIRDGRIDENEGMSIVRNNREIFFGTLAKFFPQGSQEIDRFIGIEVCFPAILDECFAVKHVKKGAEPVESLRAKLRVALEQPIKILRTRIRSRFDDTEQEEQEKKGAHAPAEKAASEFQETAPTGDVHSERTDEEVAKAIHKAATEIVKADPTGESVEELKARIEKNAMTLTKKDWPGLDFMHIEHFGRSKANVTMNQGHVFYTNVYRPLLRACGFTEVAEGESIELKREEVVAIMSSLDALLLAYARAESMNAECLDCHVKLRREWGTFLHGMISKIKA